MGRTKFGTKKQKDSSKVRVRTPAGEYVDTIAIRRRVGDKVIYLVKSPVDYGIPPKKSFFEFESGLHIGEYGVYLPEINMWLFHKTARTLRELHLLLRYWLGTYLGGSKKRCREMITEMMDASSRKEARIIRKRYYKKYGIWQYGLVKETATRGYANLLGREKEFAALLTAKRVADGGKTDEQPFSREPRIAWIGG